MTAKTLMNRHNAQSNIKVGEHICAHFLEEFHLELMKMTSSEIINNFGNYVEMYFNLK